MSSASSVASPSAAREGGSSSTRDVEQQKSVAAVGASSPKLNGAESFGGRWRTSSASSVASPSTEAEGETSSMRDVAEQKPVLAVVVWSPASSGEHHKSTVEEDSTASGEW
uniref:Uncharacterized protein n=1 Tax=Oryza sativa subsp. japonica TaxID=39947 RepID=Q69NX8_ORYSJ|nr:hypothetical protein [Oryza sativa Japonica Group]